MKQTKINLANVLLILGALGFGFGTFLSMNFLTLGDFEQSLLVSVMTTLFLGGLAFAAQRFKAVHRNFKTYIVLEVLTILLFLVAAVMTIQTFSHVFAVLEKKEDIKDKLTKNIDQAKNLFDAYEIYAGVRKDSYESKLQAVVENKLANPGEYNSYGFDDNNPGFSDTDQIDAKIFTLNIELFPSNYLDDTLNGELGIKGAAVKWLNDASSVLENDFGFMFGVVDLINDVPSKTEEWKSNLIDLSTFRADGEQASDFDYPLNFTTAKDQLTRREFPSTMSIGFALVAYFLMLVPYLVNSRSTKSPFRSVEDLFFNADHKKKSDKKDDDINVYLD
jgi:hypothetical protein